MLSKVSTKTKVKKGMDSGKKKVIFVLSLIFLSIVFYGLYNLKRIAPTNSEKISVETQTGDRPLKKEIKIKVKSDGWPLRIRQDRDPKSKVVGEIPDGTSITASEELEGWYRVNYSNVEGWVSKEYTVLEESSDQPVVATEKLPEFRGSGYTFSYPLNWSSQNYTKDESTIWIAFSNMTLPSDSPLGQVIPIELKVYPKEKPTGGFRQEGLSTKEPIAVSGINGFKYSFTSSETSTSITVVEFEKNGVLYDFYENGGYWTELDTILKSFKFS